MLCVLWLGSSVGNLKPHEAVGFFQSVQESSGPNTQVSMQPVLNVQTHKFNFLPLFAYSSGSKHCSDTICFLYCTTYQPRPTAENSTLSAPLCQPVAGPLHCRRHGQGDHASWHTICILQAAFIIAQMGTETTTCLFVADLPVHRPVERCQDVACCLL